MTQSRRFLVLKKLVTFAGYILSIKPMSYCDVVLGLEKDNVNIAYHATEYGFPIHNDNELFARLILEINQAGLSWTAILKKKDNFFKAFDDFDIQKIARYSEKKMGRLLQDE